MTSNQAKPRSKSEEAAARKARLAEALRDNLAKRKAQGRARGSGKAGDASSSKEKP